MKVIETHDMQLEYGEPNGKGSVNVTLTDDIGKVTKSVMIHAGEPEDAVFYRDLDGAFSIVDLVKAAYEAGKRGEPYEYEFADESEAV